MKPPEYPIEPEISYKSMYFAEVEREGLMFPALVLSVNFTDGDGDIGLDAGDTLGDFGLNKPYYFNFLVEYWQWNHFAKVWIPILNAQGDPQIGTGRIPNITPKGRNKSLKGIITQEIVPYEFIPTAFTDTIRFRVQLIDRNLNKSEWIYTPPVYKGVVQPE
jgi:hypothetical protein